MLVRTVAVAVAVLAGAGTATAQQRGTLELGGFVSSSSFDSSLDMNNGWGGGGRVGVFVFPRLSLEFEASGTRADRPLGFFDADAAVFTARLTGVPLNVGRVSFLVGAGLDHTDTRIIERFGLQGLLGAKVALSNYAALRVDAIQSYMPRGNHSNPSLHMGLSLYRHPRGLNTTNTVTNTVTRTINMPAVPMSQQPDPVSAAETRRLRAVEDSYRNLRDSLTLSALGATSAETATMREMIYFQNDRSDLSDAARAILTDKVTVFRSNPTMRITIVGFASQPGTDVYNMALGLRRAEAAKAYLVSQGINASRIEIATRGEGQLVIEGPGEAADAQNRRGQFSILITEQP